MDPILYRAAMEGRMEGAMEGDSNKLSESTKQFAVQFTINNNTVLHIVAEFGHSPCVARILKACPLLLLRENANGDTPLHIAAAGGRVDVVESLISFAKGGGGVAPAGGQDATAGSLTVKELLKARNRDGDTPLHLAARLENPLPVVWKLTEADQELEYTPNKAGETPLYMVVARGSDVEVVSKILEKCKSPAYRGPGGKTAMHAAVIDISKDEILDKLLAWARAPNLIKQRDSKGWTPLHFAAHNGNLEAVKKLLAKDESVAYANNDEGNTALHIATALGNVPIMNEILQKLPDCWEMANSKGRTILHIAVDMERDVAANFILKKPWVRRLMNRKDNEGNTPFHLLASKGKLGLHMYPGADMLALNNETMTPLDILNREARKKDALDAVKTMPAVYIAEMEQRLESLLAQRLGTHFEQVLDAISGHRTVKGSTGDETSPVEHSHA